VKDYTDVKKLDLFQIRGLNQIGLQDIKTEKEEELKHDKLSSEHKVEEFRICGSDYEED